MNTFAWKAPFRVCNSMLLSTPMLSLLILSLVDCPTSMLSALCMYSMCMNNYLSIMYVYMWIVTILYNKYPHPLLGWLTYSLRTMWIFPRIIISSSSKNIAVTISMFSAPTTDNLWKFHIIFSTLVQYSYKSYTEILPIYYRHKNQWRPWNLT